MAAGAAAAPEAAVAAAVATGAVGSGVEKTRTLVARHPVHIQTLTASGRLLLMLIMPCLVEIHLCMLLCPAVRTRVILKVADMLCIPVLVLPLSWRKAFSRYHLRIQRTRLLQAFWISMMRLTTTSI